MYGSPIIKTILLTGGSISLGRTVTFALGNAGYRVLTASGAKDAFAKLETDKVQLVLADPGMGEANGLAFLRHLRSLPEHTFTPVVMLSSECHEPWADLWRQEGVSAWVIKPFTPEQLAEVVKKLVR